MQTCGLLSELLNAYLERRGSRIRPGTRRLTEQVWGQMLNICGDIEVARFDRAQAEDVVDGLMGQGLRAVTVRSYTKTLRPAFRRPATP